jgi:chromosome condensin MukBEF ATPase and DNA-binding subunit MukB
MTEEQEILAEKILQLHRDGDGIFEWEELNYDDENSILPPGLSVRKRSDLLELIKATLIEMGLIETTTEEGDITRLKTRGWEFSTFANERLKAAEVNRVSKLSIEKLDLEVDELRKKLFDYDTTKAQAKWAIRFAAVSAVGSIAAILIALLK